MDLWNALNLTAGEFVGEVYLTVGMTLYQFAILFGYGLGMLMSLCFLMVVATRILQYFLRSDADRDANDLKTMIILGSGGHTREILNMTGRFSHRFSPRVYVYSQSDPLSMEKAREFEINRPKNAANKFLSILRLREVGEGLHVLLYRTPLALFQAAVILIREKPDLIVCNGPGVCVPICVISYLLKKLWLSSTRIIFIESICRVETLSLTGRILIYLANAFIVQWEELENMCKSRYPNARVHYLGRLA